MFGESFHYAAGSTCGQHRVMKAFQLGLDQNVTSWDVGTGSLELMAFNTVRHYTQERVIEHSKDGAECVGSPRWLTLGLTSIVQARDGAVATLYSYHGRMGVDKEEKPTAYQSSTKCEFKLDLGVNGDELVAAYIIDGPLLVTSQKFSGVKVHYLQSTVGNGTCSYAELSGKGRRVATVRELGSIGDVVITTLLMCDAEGDAPLHKATHFSVLELIRLFKAGQQMLRLGDRTEERPWGTIHVGHTHEVQPSVPLRVPCIFSDALLDGDSADLMRVFPVIAPISGGRDAPMGIRCAAYSAEGLLSIHEICFDRTESAKHSLVTLSRRALPLREGSAVVDLVCFESTICVSVRPREDKGAKDEGKGAPLCWPSPRPCWACWWSSEAA